MHRSSSIKAICPDLVVLAGPKTAEYSAPCILLPFVNEDVPVKERAPAMPLYVPPKLIAVVPIVIAKLVSLVFDIPPALRDAVIFPPE